MNKHIIFGALLGLLLIGGSANGQNTQQISRSGDRVLFPYSEKITEVQTTPNQWSMIYLKPGEKILNHSRPGGVQFSYRSRVTNGNIQPMLRVRPTGYGIQRELTIKTTDRSYQLNITAIGESEKGTERERSTPRLIAFGKESHLPGLGKEKPLSVAVNSSTQLDSTDEENSGEEADLAPLIADSIGLRYSAREGKHGFPWEPDSLYQQEGNLVISVGKELLKHGTPTVYELTEQGRVPVNIRINKMEGTLVTSRPMRKGVAVYEFEHPGLFGLYTATSERQLFIHSN